MPKQGHTQSDNDSGPRLRGEGTNLGNGYVSAVSPPGHMFEVAGLCAIKGWRQK